ncbi:MAG: DUF3387 domain-containing protein [Candidatus Poribacteria bacterium]|nr:DUF3387 domain-containing protein [Candidatus Poribacteria bacterium]MDP6999398.1 DUF3387 domain-containing protein [Candidatus Poribacteria bacterium]
MSSYLRISSKYEGHASYQGKGSNSVYNWVCVKNRRVKRILRRFRYPPDMQALTTETVLQQAELIADEITQQS